MCNVLMTWNITENVVIIIYKYADNCYQIMKNNFKTFCSKKRSSDNTRKILSNPKATKSPKTRLIPFPVKPPKVGILINREFPRQNKYPKGRIKPYLITVFGRRDAFRGRIRILGHVRGHSPDPATPHFIFAYPLRAENKNRHPCVFSSLRFPPRVLFSRAEISGIVLEAEAV